MLRRQIMAPRHIRNYRTRRDRLGNDPPLLLIAPSPPANHPRDFPAARNNIRVVTNVDHNVHTIPRESRSCTTRIHSAMWRESTAYRVPQWPDGDPHFKDPESYTERYEWEIEGRKLCATNYGKGIGSNAWKDADVVFLFDEFFLPRRIAAATVQGLRGHKANEGALALMKTVNSKAEAIDLIGEGHRLRWTKQMALRGRGRYYD